MSERASKRKFGYLGLKSVSASGAKERVSDSRATVFLHVVVERQSD